MLLHNLTRSCTTERIRWCNLLQQQQLSLSRHWHDSKSKSPSTAVSSLPLSLLRCVVKGDQPVNKNKTRQNFVGNGLIYDHRSFLVLFTSWNQNSYNSAVVSEAMKVIVICLHVNKHQFTKKGVQTTEGLLKANYRSAGEPLTGSGSENPPGNYIFHGSLNFEQFGTNIIQTTLKNWIQQTCSTVFKFIF